MSDQHKGHRDRGVAAVEMALVLPLFIILIFGLIDFGLAFNAQIQISTAAREGARIAAIDPSVGSTLADHIDTRAKAAVSDSMADDLTITQSTCPAPADPTSTDAATVKVTYPFTFTIPLGPFKTITLSSTASMRCGG